MRGKRKDRDYLDLWSFPSTRYVEQFSSPMHQKCLDQKEYYNSINKPPTYDFCGSWLLLTVVGAFCSALFRECSNLSSIL